MIFLNLTNGIEALPLIGAEPPRFVRIQSTACEQKRWSAIIEDLDYDFLLYLAQGIECVVVDYSSKPHAPRALWQGLPWIRFACERRWLQRDEPAFVKQHNVTGYFRQAYDELSSKAKAKLGYVKKFVNCDRIQLSGVGWQTNLDGKYATYRQLLCGLNRTESLMPVHFRT